jgi:hypothetical protein
MTLYAKEKDAIALARGIATAFKLKVAVIVRPDSDSRLFKGEALAKLALEIETTPELGEQVSKYFEGFERATGAL